MAVVTSWSSSVPEPLVLGCSALAADRESLQRLEHRLFGDRAGRGDAHPGQGRDALARRQVAVLVSDLVGCDDELVKDLHHRCGASIDRRTARVVQSTDSLDRGRVLDRRDTVRRRGGAGGLVGVDRNGLAQSTPLGRSGRITSTTVSPSARVARVMPAP